MPGDKMYLYCFYADNKKNEITQLYPNLYAQQAHRAAHESFTLPSPEMPFKIKMDHSGSDTYACFGTSENISTELTRHIGSKALEPISDMSLNDVNVIIHDLSAGNMVKQQMTIKVR